MGVLGSAQKWNRRVLRVFEDSGVLRIKEMAVHVVLRKNTNLFFIIYDEVIIGFVQIYKYNDKIIKMFNSYNNVFEYDIFIGESEYLSKGIEKNC